ncbi:MAG TPA: DUF4349 domain-containing protein [Hymenobacter sp.]|jgi:hypothetical protein
MKNTLGIALGLAALLSSCSHVAKEAETEANDSSASKQAYISAAPLISADSPELAEEATADVLPGPRPLAESIGAASRLLIYHADLKLKVASLPRASASLDSLVRRSGGYLSAATEVRADGEWRQALTIRVLPARFHALMAALGGLGTVEEKKMTTDDVTAQHADISARLNTKRVVEQRYIALLARAKKISEVLEVEEKIGEVREEIESTESRLKTLNSEVAYSTIFLVCYQPLAQPVPDAPIVSLGSRLLSGLYDGWSLLTSLLVGIISIWPLLLLGLLAGWLVYRQRRRFRAAKS